MASTTMIRMGCVYIYIYILGLYCRDNGKEHGNYYIMIGYILGLFGV